MIIVIGSRFRSHWGTQFRRCATCRLHEYLMKWCTMDDDRLKEEKTLGADYYNEFIERIRDIWRSEKRFYQIFKEISTFSFVYDPKTPIIREFFLTVLNKIHDVLLK